MTQTTKDQDTMGRELFGIFPKQYFWESISNIHTGIGVT